MKHPTALAALVFGAGTGSLATEIAASRLIAPYFGSSTIVWANLIGIVLAMIALGWGIVQLVALPLGGLDAGVSIFYGFLLVILVLGVLAWRGRRKQREAQAARRAG